MLTKLRPVLTTLGLDATRMKLDISWVRQKSTRNRDTLISLQGDLLYGIHPVSMALRAGRRDIYKIYYNKGSSKAEKVAQLGKSLQIPTEATNRYVLDEMTRQTSRYKDHHVHQGLVADVSRLHHIPVDYRVPQLDLDVNQRVDELNNKHDFILLLYGLKDPMNLGALLRSAFYFGVSSLVVGGGKVDLSPVVSKSSVGAMEVLPIYAVRNVEDFLTEKRSAGWDVLALTLPSESIAAHSSIQQVGRCSKPTILVVGSEGDGLPDSVLKCANLGVYIEPSANITPEDPGYYLDSLNVSVATGIALHTLLQKP